MVDDGRPFVFDVVVVVVVDDCDVVELFVNDDRFHRLLIKRKRKTKTQLLNIL